MLNLILNDLIVIKKAAERIEKALVGRNARITSDYNGQPYGRSKKSQRGQIAKIIAVVIDPDESVGISVRLEGRDLYLGLDEIELI